MLGRRRSTGRDIIIGTVASLIATAIASALITTCGGPASIHLDMHFGAAAPSSPAGVDMSNTDPTSPRRGVLRTPDGTLHELPDWILDEVEIGWPLTHAGGRPGERTPVQEAYRRHELEPGVFLYLKEHVDTTEVPPAVIDRLMRGGR